MHGEQNNGIWNMRITGFGIQILLHKYKAEQTEAICKLLLAFIAHKLQEY